MIDDGDYRQQQEAEEAEWQKVFEEEVEYRKREDGLLIIQEMERDDEQE